MKFIVVLLLLSSFLFAQQREWSEKIRFGTKFYGTDSLKLKNSVDSLYASGAKDTLFSDAIAIDGKDIEGIYGISSYFEGISGTSASIILDVRFGVKFIDRYTNTSTRNQIRWDAVWNSIWSCKKDTLYRMGIASADSSWWNPAATYRQYRLREADADTVFFEVADFIR